LHIARFDTDLPLALPKYFMRAQLLGDTILREYSYRSSLDFTFCISPSDVELERWLGGGKVDWLPRAIIPDPLIWNPSGDRLGFVGTLDHVPSVEGLILFLRNFQKIAPANIRVRVVGGPDRIGQLLTAHFPIVDYLGPLPNDALRREASTWSCFVNPIFCLPRGCSTKLATAIGWQIPIVTTTSGHRGYAWDRGVLPVADRPPEFSDLALSMLHVETAQKAHSQISEIARSSPSITDVGKKIASILGIEILELGKGAPTDRRDLRSRAI
jgi:hypothetical protein